jgi:endo-1,4-beta-xylanase
MKRRPFIKQTGMVCSSLAGANPRNITFGLWHALHALHLNVRALACETHSIARNSVQRANSFASHNSSDSEPSSLFNRLSSFVQRAASVVLMLGLSLGVAPAILAQPEGQALLPTELSQYRVYGVGLESAIKEVPVEAQPFDRALRIDTTSLSNTNGLGMVKKIVAPVKKGDVLWLSFKARSIKSTRESGDSLFTISFDRLVNGKYKWPSFAEQGVAVGREWTEISLPFKMDADADSQNSQLQIRLDTYPGAFELGPVTLLNYGQEVPLASLPRSRVRYDGSDPESAWRKAAAERIEHIRKGDLALRIVDGAGQPVPDAKVAVNMKRIAFDFGTAVNSRQILGTNADAEKYREILKKYFNQIVFDNEMKFWGPWGDPDYQPVQTLKSLDWLDEHGITARGHVMVWPSFKNSPKSFAVFKDDKEGLRTELQKGIVRQATTMRGRFAQWDVVNELSLHHQFTDMLGMDEMVKWFETAHANDPNCKLFFNEYTMFFQGDGWKHFYDSVKFLKEKNAPIHGIGEQGHIGGTPPGIPFVLERLDKFAELGYPIIISEFDINSNDQDFQARYTHDFMTAVFSHPSMTGLVQWGFWEPIHWFPIAAMWEKDWTIRKHGEAYIALIKEWRTDFEGTTNVDGAVGTRAFFGEAFSKTKRNTYL